MVSLGDCPGYIVSQRITCLCSDTISRKKKKKKEASPCLAQANLQQLGQGASLVCGMSKSFWWTKTPECLCVSQCVILASEAETMHHRDCWVPDAQERSLHFSALALSPTLGADMLKKFYKTRGCFWKVWLRRWHIRNPAFRHLQSKLKTGSLGQTLLALKMCCSLTSWARVPVSRGSMEGDAARQISACVHFLEISIPVRCLLDVSWWLGPAWFRMIRVSLG